MKSIDEIIKERDLTKIAAEKKRKEDVNIKRENIKNETTDLSHSLVRLE